MGIIKELWYGNVNPNESGIFNTSKIKELTEYITQHRTALDETLSDEQKVLFEKFLDYRNEQESILETIIFEYGFKLGARFVAESLLSDGETDNE